MKLSSLLRCLAIMSCAVALPQAGSAERVGFVLGINAYDKVLPRLSTPVNDAAAIEEALLAAKFKVVRLSDPTLEKFAETWREFLGSLKPGDTVAFYFAGHALQIDGLNYLFLKDTPWLGANDNAILEGSLNFYDLMEQLHAREPARAIYILDACRNSLLEGKAAKAPLGKALGYAATEIMDSAFIMYSAGPGQKALDSLLDPVKEVNSVYTRRLLPLLKNKDLHLVDIATRVREQVEADAKLLKHSQRPQYYDGLSHHYYLGRMEAPSDAPPTSRMPGSNVVRLGGFATWDENCRGRPAPRVTAKAPPRYGRIVTRFESFTIAGTHAGTVSCDNTTLKGIGIYYVIDDAFNNSPVIESLQFTIQHWSISPSETITETFHIDLARKQSRRVTIR